MIKISPYMADMARASAVRREEMRRLRAAGLTLAQIGTRYGVGRQRVWQLLREKR